MSSAAMKIPPITFDQIEAALKAGKVEMQRPWGDWVPVRRRGVTEWSGDYGRLPVFMENQVESTISTEGAKVGFHGVRISAARRLT